MREAVHCPHRLSLGGSRHLESKPVLYLPKPASGRWELQEPALIEVQEQQGILATVVHLVQAPQRHASAHWTLPGASFFAQPPKLFASDAARHVTAGTLARTLAQAAIHPIDTVKTRLQINKSTAPEQLRMWRHTTKCHRIDVYLGSQRVLHVRNVLIQGPRDLLRGFSGAVLGTLPTAACYFCVYEGVKSRMEARGCTQAVTHLASASLGAVLSALVRVPADTLKHRTQAYLVPNCWQGAQSIMQTEGPRGFYHGLLPTLLRDVPEIALQFYLYERLRQALQGRRRVSKLRTWEHLALGGISGGCAATVTMPLDVAKTALQCGVSAPVHAVLRLTLQSRGVKGLFAGMGPRVAQTAINSALFFVLFEMCKAQLKRERDASDLAVQPKLWTKRRQNVWKRTLSPA